MFASHFFSPCVHRDECVQSWTAAICLEGTIHAEMCFSAAVINMQIYS